MLDMIISSFLPPHILTTYFPKDPSFLDVHESVHRDPTMKITNKMHYID